MTGPRSLQLRIALMVGLAVTVLWLVAASVTGYRLRHELDIEFDGALRDTAHRLLHLADSGERPDRPGRLRGHGRKGHGSGRKKEGRRDALGDFYSYRIVDDKGHVVLASEDAVASNFPPFESTGFVRTDTRTLFYDRVKNDDGVLTIVVAEPRSRRAMVVGEIVVSLSRPLLLMIPLMFAAIFLIVRFSLAPMRQLRDDLGQRGAHKLAPLADNGLPSELTPIVGSINALLARLGAAFEAERSFAANAAHELRTPVAGAIAQAQRLQAETDDAGVIARARDIENTLKRLNRLSEKLMQLARAEGARLRTGTSADLRPILRIVVEDFERYSGAGRLELSLPETPILSDLDPDAFGILSRNLIENALKHGAAQTPVKVELSAPAVLSVANAGCVVLPEDLDRLTARFARSNDKTDGSGLGLAIVKTIADRTGARLEFNTPAPGRTDGIEVRVSFPRSD
ncbi:two-component system OmpR family sensor kinase [Breoghania corrubedonensis]|uniref:histidine kinase n=1 Tax=Breoghania corrubedonensis TaxID=665038 RepID=A0A2T5US44_9HYPH|nr:ATP-binding protein [Breoghania corrubedonensis]PTW54322.1 two-component system OmpR family sensor kinase [Breoghania corrubedonensis]